MPAPTSLFQFQVPAESQNIFLNPSGESTANYSAVGTATVTRSTTVARYTGPDSRYSWRIQAAAGNDGIQITTRAMTNTTTWVSFWLYGTWSTVAVKIGSTTVTPIAYETDGGWTWFLTLDTNFTGAQANGQTAAQILLNAGADVYLDDALCQQGTFWTTTFHGGFPSGVRWEGIAHQSVSTLLPTVGDNKPNLVAGRVYDMDNRTNLIVSSYLGFGLAEYERLTRSTIDRGGQFESANLSARTMVLSTLAVGSGRSMANLLSTLGSLIDYIQPGQEFVFRYRGTPTFRGGTADVQTTICVYGKGLEGAWNMWAERVNLTLIAHSPQWLTNSATVTALTASATITGDYVYTRRRSVWSKPIAGGSPGAALQCVLITSKGHVFVGGTGGVWGSDGNSWGTVGTATGGTTIVYAMCTDPTETYLYVTGSFTNIGGTAANYVARYAIPATGVTGGAWAALSTGLGALGRALCTVPTASGHDLYIGGDFTSPGNYFVKWTDAAFATISPNTLNAAVYALVFDGVATIYLGGNFTNLATVTASSPQPTNTHYTDGNIPTTKIDGSPGDWCNYKIANIYAGEVAVSSAAAATSSSGGSNALSWATRTGVAGYAIYRAIDSSAPPLAGQYYYLTTTTLTSFIDDGTFLVDTNRTPPGSNGTGGKRVGKYNVLTSAWSAVTGRLIDAGAGASAGLNGICHSLSLAPDLTTLYAAGAFTTADGTTVNGFAMFNGQQWVACGGGVTGGTFTTCFYDPTRNVVHVGGDFTSAGATGKPGTTGAQYALWWPGESGSGVWSASDLSLPASFNPKAFALSPVTDDLWLVGASNSNATGAALTSVTAAGMGGAFLNYPQVVIDGPGRLLAIVNETTGQEMLFNLLVGDGERVVIDLGGGRKTVVSISTGQPRHFYYLAGDLFRFGLVSGTNRLTVLLTGTGGNTLVRLFDPTSRLAVNS